MPTRRYKMVNSKIVNEVVKFAYYSLLLVIASCLLASCDSNITNMGQSIRPEGDQIKVATDTFRLSTANVFVEKMYNRPDSLLLGTFKDDRYGTTYADILARFEAAFDSVGFRYPEGAVPDSTFLLLSYRSWFGADNSAMSVKVYEMNQGKYLDYYTYYPTNIDVSEYCDQSELLGDAVFSAGDSTQLIRLKLTDSFTQRLFENTRDFTNEEDFFRRFNGLYITSPLGDATMMYLNSVSMALYYHYDATVAGKDTTFVNTTSYVVDGAVVNRFLHPDTARVKDYLAQHDSINYVASPANIYAQVNVPLRRMVQQMKDSVGDKRLVVNGANVRVEVKDTQNEMEDSDITVPLPDNMLLMKKDEVDAFFRDEGLPTDSVVYTSYSSADSCYTFNIAAYITREIQKVSDQVSGEVQIESMPEQLELMMLPVRVVLSSTSSGSSSVSEVSQQVLINGVTIRSGNDRNRPMTMEVVYSGF